MNIKYVASNVAEVNRNTSNHKSSIDNDKTTDGGRRTLVKHSTSTSSFMGHQNASINSNIMMKMNNILKSTTIDGSSNNNRIDSFGNDHRTCYGDDQNKNIHNGSSIIPVGTGRPKIIAKVKRQENKSTGSADFEAAVPLNSQSKLTEDESKESLVAQEIDKVNEKKISNEKPCETEFTYRLEIDNTDGALNNCFIAERPEETIKRLRQQMRGK